MQTRPTQYGIRAADVVTYMQDIETRWGVRLGADIRMMETATGASVLALTVGVYAPEHQAELGNPPNVHQFIGRLAEQDIWGATWDAIYEWDEQLTRHLAGL